MIPKLLAHQMLNKLQVILGQVTLGTLEPTELLRDLRFEKAKAEIKSLAEYIRERTHK